MTPIIRQYRFEDAYPFMEAVLETANEAWRWLPWCHPGYTLEDAQKWMSMQGDFWQAGIEYNFLIVDEESGKILGGTGINTIRHEHQFANLGYWVRKSQMNKGIATAAAKFTIEFAFTSLNLNRIEILMATGNTASKKVAMNIGAVYEGIARDRILLHEKFVDAYVFSVIKRDWIL